MEYKRVPNRTTLWKAFGHVVSQGSLGASRHLVILYQDLSWSGFTPCTYLARGGLEIGRTRADGLTSHTGAYLKAHRGRKYWGSASPCKKYREGDTHRLIQPHP